MKNPGESMARTEPGVRVRVRRIISRTPAPKEIKGERTDLSIIEKSRFGHQPDIAMLL
jgi:hypothetical protein